MGLEEVIDGEFGIVLVLLEVEQVVLDLLELECGTIQLGDCLRLALVQLRDLSARRVDLLCVLFHLVLLGPVRDLFGSCFFTFCQSLIEKKKKKGDRKLKRKDERQTLQSAGSASALRLGARRSWQRFAPVSPC